MPENTSVPRLQSESIDQLAIALATAQGEMSTAGKNASAPLTKDGRAVRRYADLSAVFEVLRETLPKHGLAVTQLLLPREDGKAHIRTVLLHKSGQWIASECVMPCDRQGGIQGMGSAITYARRYSLSALVGVVSEEDDDGAGAQGDRKREQPTAPQRAQDRQQSPPPQRKPAGVSAPHPQPPTRQAAPHISLEEAQWEFTTCNSPEALLARAKELQIRADNPDYASIQAAYNARMAALKTMGDGDSPPSRSDVGAEQRLTPGQRTAIMTHYSKRGMADAAHRDARLRDLSNYFGRPVNSVNDLSAAEAADFLDAINRNQTRNGEAA